MSVGSDSGQPAPPKRPNTEQEDPVVRRINKDFMEAVCCVEDDPALLKKLVSFHASSGILEATDFRQLVWSTLETFKQFAVRQPAFQVNKCNYIALGSVGGLEKTFSRKVQKPKNKVHAISRVFYGWLHRVMRWQILT